MAELPRHQKKKIFAWLRGKRVASIENLSEEEMFRLLMTISNHVITSDRVATRLLILRHQRATYTETPYDCIILFREN